MELKKLPFYPDVFTHHSHYMRARNEFYTQEYVGKEVVFNEDLIDISGNTRHAKRERVRICEVGYEWFKIEYLNHTPIEGIFNPRIFDETAGI